MSNLSKRGMSMDFYTIIFLVLNLSFFSIMFLFVYNAQSNSIAYEQVYAKQVALLLDSASPGMIFNLNFDDGFDIAEKNNKFSGIVFIDEENNLVKVMLKNSGGYQMSYFSDYSFVLQENLDSKKIRIEVLNDK